MLPRYIIWCIPSEVFKILEVWLSHVAAHSRNLESVELTSWYSVSCAKSLCLLGLPEAKRGGERSPALILSTPQNSEALDWHTWSFCQFDVSAEISGKEVAAIIGCRCGCQDFRRVGAWHSSLLKVPQSFLLKDEHTHGLLLYLHLFQV